jgi:hypothetical protein
MLNSPGMHTLQPVKVAPFESRHGPHIENSLPLHVWVPLMQQLRVMPGVAQGWPAPVSLPLPAAPPGLAPAPADLEAPASNSGFPPKLPALSVPAVEPPCAAAVPPEPLPRVPLVPRLG